MSFRNLFHWSYWFSQPEPAAGWIFKVWLFIFLALILAGLLALIIGQRQKYEPQKKLYSRAASLCVTMGFLALVWLGLRQERVAFLAWRFWLLFWALILALWAGRILKYIFWRLPEVRREQAARSQREKYLTN